MLATRLSLRLPVLRTFATTTARAAGITDVLKHDHRELEEYYEKIVSAADHDTKTRFQNQFTWELARHSLGEEIVVYPAFAKHVPGGQQMADKDRAQHQELKNLLYEFQAMKSTDAKFEPTIKALYAKLAQHIREEEQDDLPALEKAIPAGDSDAMALSFERTKMLVPTRSHPSAPDKPPFETVAGLLTAPIDKIMDIFRKFPESK